MSDLYEELRDLAMEDATIYAFLKTQQASGVSDLHTATLLIRQLAKEKKAYFDDAVQTRNLSIIPVQPIKMFYEKPKWYQWRKRQMYRKLLETK